MKQTVKVKLDTGETRRTEVSLGLAQYDVPVQVVHGVIDGVDFVLKPHYHENTWYTLHKFNPIV